MASPIVTADLRKGKDLNRIPGTKKFRASALSRSKIMKFLNELFFYEEELSHPQNGKIKKDQNQT